MWQIIRARCDARRKRSKSAIRYDHRGIQVLAAADVEVLTNYTRRLVYRIERYAADGDVQAFSRENDEQAPYMLSIYIVSSIFG